MNQKEFDKGFGGIMFLLVQLSNQPECLVQGLASTFSLFDPSEIKSIDELTLLEEQRDHSWVLSQLSLIKTKTVNSEGEEMVVPQSMIAEPYYVVPIEKRSSSDPSFTEVKVGRARNNDIVLRHPSVSKLHAIFLTDQVGALGLQDAASKNKTWVNGEIITGRVNVETGDSIRIGSVETVLCNAITLRNTLDLVVTQLH
ncbi:MAG: FHA domain-containing protein [Deltaproteobacteria bacterium]|nr:FHA domain-containing protein [Deltaproteobacteria bacterium]